MKNNKILLSFFPLLLVGCATVNSNKEYKEKFFDEIKATKAEKIVTEKEWNNLIVANSSISINSLLPQKDEIYFSIKFKNTPLKNVLESLVLDSDYSIVFSDDEDLNKPISINLKSVTLSQALKTLRSTYKINYVFEDKIIKVYPNIIQTRVFDINYLIGGRVGKSETKVISGSITGSPSGSNTTGGATNIPTTNNSQNGGSQTTQESSKITTNYQNDIWSNLISTIKTMIDKAGTKGNVSIIPASGQLVVTGYANDLMDVEMLINKMHKNIGKQVMIEAKIVEVSLSDGFQSGVNWAGFNKNNGTQKWVIGGNTDNFSVPNGTINTSASFTGANGIFSPISIAGAALSTNLMGIAFQTSSFASLMQFLDTQGQTHVLSSPRISTLNNQKAVLKVGTDDFFVTNVTTNSSSNGTTTVNTPSISLQPFFSGVALDVTPEIDDKDNIILHIKPSVSNVVEKQKNINLGTMGNYILPLASSTVSEADSVIKAKDGYVVALGGLMKTNVNNIDSGLPGLKDIPIAGNLVKQQSKNVLKSELVILLKPTIIQNSNFSNELDSIKKSLEGMNK